MTRMVWEVDFNVVGPIKLSNNIRFRQEKGFDQQQFYSDIYLEPKRAGFSATITAYADSIDTAETVAYVYFGKMRDVLSMTNDIPIQLSGNEGFLNMNQSFKSRRILEKKDIIIAFKKARNFEIDHPKLLRAISWYSKGKLSFNTFDKFIAYWNVIEILSKEYHTPTNRTTRGIKNQIYQCFLDYFGDTPSWGIEENWLDEIYQKRNDIYHGGQDITLEEIKETSRVIPLLEKVSKRLIDRIIEDKYRDFDFLELDFLDF